MKAPHDRQKPLDFFHNVLHKCFYVGPYTNRPGIIIDLLSNVWVGPLVQRLLYITAFIRITFIIILLDC